MMLGEDERKCGSLIHSVSVAEFDIKVGVTLSHVYPPQALDGGFDKAEVASLCLPDGGHKVAEDWTFMVFPSPEDTTRYIYGLSFFRNVPDPSVPRGAVQMALLLLVREPFFLLFQPIVREALSRIMDHSETDTLKLLYEKLEAGLTTSVQLHLFDKHFLLNIPSLHVDPFPGASLSSLCITFREEVLQLWYAALSGQRVLFLASTGELAGNACLALPILALPLRGFEDILTPYVQLTDMKALEAPCYIAGTTNPMMATMTMLHDVVANVDSGHVTVHAGKVPQLSSKDTKLIKRVLAGIQEKKGEKWVRRQFFKRTEMLLTKVEKLTAHQQLACVLETPRYNAWKVQVEKDATNSQQSPCVLSFFELQEVLDTESERAVTAVQLMKLFYDLDTNLLADPDDVAQIVDLGGVGVVAHGLASQVAQVRKSAINLIAKLSISVTGQCEILQLGLLPVIGQLLNDRNTKVLSAAVGCLQKVASLYIGAKGIVSSDLIAPLLATLYTLLLEHGGGGARGDGRSDGDENSVGGGVQVEVACYCIAATLMSVYKFLPYAPVPNDVRIAVLLSSRDTSFTDLFTELLDMWGFNVPFSLTFDRSHPLVAVQDEASALATASLPRSRYNSIVTQGIAQDADTFTVSPDPQLVRYLSAIRGCECMDQMGALLATLSQYIARSKALVIQAVHLDAIEALLLKGFLAPSVHLYGVWETLARFGNTSVGLARLHSAGILQHGLVILGATTTPSLDALYVCCFVESLLQHARMADAFLDERGDVFLLDFIVTRCGNEEAASAAQHDFVFLCFPLLRSLRYMYKCLSTTALRDTMRQNVQRSRIQYLVNVEVNTELQDPLDFQALLISFLATCGLLERSYLEWIVTEKQRVDAVTLCDSTQQQRQQQPTQQLPQQEKSGEAIVQGKEADRPGGEGGGGGGGGGDNALKRLFHSASSSLVKKRAQKPRPLAPSEEQVLKCGFLEKKMDWRLVWKFRWFLLTEDSLLYYKGDEKAFAGMLVLSECRVCVTDNGELSIITAKKKILLRGGDTAPDRAEDWAAAIEKAMADKKEREREALRAEAALRVVQPLGECKEISDGCEHLSFEKQPSPSVFESSLRSNMTLRRLGRTHNLSSTSQIDTTAIMAAGTVPSLASIADNEPAPSLPEEQQSRLGMKRESHFAPSIRTSLSLRRISSFNWKSASALQHEDKAKYGNRHSRRDSWTFPLQY